MEPSYTSGMGIWSFFSFCLRWTAPKSSITKKPFFLLILSCCRCRKRLSRVPSLELQLLSSLLDEKSELSLGDPLEHSTRGFGPGSSGGGGGATSCCCEPGGGGGGRGGTSSCSEPGWGGGGGGGGSAGGDSGRLPWEADFAVLAVFLNNFPKSFNYCADISFPDFIILCTSSPNLNASLSNLLALALNLFRS